MAAPEAPEPRVERVLDSAAELLVRWGYQRVTIDEVARHAGIGKGTVYLHFRTKEALFLTVLLRTHRRVAERMVQLMEADPASVLPAAMMRESYLELAADPVLRALYLGDAEVLGRLAHEAATTLGELTERRSEAFREHLRLLQAAGCLRGDLPVDALRYTLTAIVMGFYTVDGMQLPGPDPEVTEKAALLEQAIAAALQVPDPPGAELERLAPAIAQLYRPLIEHIDHEWRRRVR
jgi:AcrR family transcriptional regulator